MKSNFIFQIERAANAIKKSTLSEEAKSELIYVNSSIGRRLSYHKYHYDVFCFYAEDSLQPLSKFSTVTRGSVDIKLACEAHTHSFLTNARSIFDSVLFLYKCVDPNINILNQSDAISKIINEDIKSIAQEIANSEIFKIASSIDNSNKHRGLTRILLNEHGIVVLGKQLIDSGLSKKNGSKFYIEETPIKQFMIDLDNFLIPRVTLIHKKIIDDIEGNVIA